MGIGQRGRGNLVVCEGVRWSVFADLDRRLDDDERGDLFAAIDAEIPDSGCVGPNRAGVEEVYFVIEADSAAAARDVAAEYMDRVLAASGVRVGYTITLQASSR